MSKEKRHFDDVFAETGLFGGYQIFCILTLQYAWIGICTMASGSFLSLGGLKPTYVCHDTDFENNTDSCSMIKNCTNLTVTSQFYSVYEEFEWVCLSPHLPTMFASLVGLPAIAGFLVGGHIADHYGRKWPTIIGLSVCYACGFAAALAPSWKFYICCYFVWYLFASVSFCAMFSLGMETVNKKYRLLQGFAYQWTFAFMFAGLIAYLTRNWRSNLLFACGATAPSLIMCFFWVESPRWLIHERRYADAAAALNRIAWFNRKKADFTAEQMALVDLGPEAHHKKYNALHLCASKKLILYTISQSVTGIGMHLVMFIVFINIQDLAGSPFVNTALFGILRIWSPIAVLFEQKCHWFGRRTQLLASLGVVFLCYLTIVIIYASGNRENLHTITTGLALFGFAVTVSWTSIAFDQFSSEIYPTVIRSIALGILNIMALMGDVIGPQLVYLGLFWQPMPYAGAAFGTFCGFCLSYFILPETKGRPLPDTLEGIDTKEQKKLLVANMKNDNVIISEMKDGKNGLV